MGAYIQYTWCSLVVKIPCPIDADYRDFWGFLKAIRVDAAIVCKHHCRSYDHTGICKHDLYFRRHECLGGYGTSVVSMLFSAALSLLEILVAFLQAYVFTLLSAIYFGMAKVEDHH